MTIGGYCCCRAITWPTRVQGRFQEATAYLVDSERAPECQLGGQPGHPPHCKQHQARPLLCLLCMMLPSVLLLVIGVLGAMDIVWFHSWKGRLASRPECRREVTLHVLRGLVYAAQFVAVPNVQFHGTWYFAWLLLFAADVSIAVADIWEEPQSRLAQGGLLRGEYLMHMVLSVLVGAMLCAAFSNSWSWFHQPTQVVWVTQVHWPLRALLALMAAVSIGVSVMEWLIVLESTWRRPDPLHVRVRLPAPVHQVWNVTQDHRFHPQWDHRFDSIVMCHEVDGEHQGPRFTPDARITEVRNSMGVILAELKLLEHSGADTESVQSIRQQVMRTSQFVDELLRYAKPQSMMVTPVEVVSLLRASLAAVGQTHHGVARVTLTVPLRLEVEADARALDSVFTNLITNAVIATEASGAPVEVTLLQTSFGFECSVKDRGPGVPPALVARLFEPFVTGRGRDSKHPGTGLGLALSARLAQRHGASIEHRRPAEGGAHFIIHWPMVPVVPKEFST